MAKISTGQSFNAGDQLTSTKLNNIIGTAFLDSDSVTGTTLNLTSGQLKVATNGITDNELKSDASVDANRAVGTNHIKDDAVTYDKIQEVAANSVIGNTTASAANPTNVAILDEDNMLSDSATSLATQQSIKAYVESYVSNNLPQFYAFSSSGITSEGQTTLNYPGGWTNGLPDKVLVSTRYPTGDSTSQQWFQVVSFDSTSVTVYAQSQNVTSWTNPVFADVLLVKN